jgi:hypothetical protein
MVARNLLLKALTEVAGADTEVTRLIAHRGALEAAQ